MGILEGRARSDGRGALEPWPRSGEGTQEVMAFIGYARVSTDEQTTDPQLLELRKFGCARIFEEHGSGGDRSRPELARALAAVKRGDTLVVVRIDRLARSLAHLLEIIETLEKRGAHFKSLNDPIDTGSPQGRFTLQILGAVAEFERQLIRERTRAGMKSAEAQGRVPGNPGLRFKESGAKEKIAAARNERLDEMVILEASEFLPTVRKLRPQHKWERVVAVLNAGNKRRPSDHAPWTRDSLVRVVRRLVRNGLAEPELLQAAPRKAKGDTHITEIVAGIWNASAKQPTLAKIGAQLERMRIRTPRGGDRWSVSSIKMVLDRARAAGLLAEDAAATSVPTG